MNVLNDTNMNTLIDIVKRRIARAENAVVRDFFAQQGIEGDAADKAEIEYRRRMNGGFSAINPDDCRPHGRWIKVADLCGVEVLKCSVCGEEHPRIATAFCCDCGALMDGKENNA